MTNLLETERLIIRTWIPERDAEQAFVIYSDPEVTHFLGKASLVTSVESQRQRLIGNIERSHQRNNRTEFWAIVEKETTTGEWGVRGDGGDEGAGGAGEE
ncbi:GNAT family N-acetyltransferase [Nostoc sp.]|uniref:GNAT family N-acetyltransferase n=1 Tax=Nostoc sp. TaxID=1180 RepID=UPI002FF9AA6C